MHRRTGSILLSLAFALLSAADAWRFGPLLDTPSAQRPQLWLSAAVVAVAASAAAWYRQRRRAPAS